MKVNAVDSFQYSTLNYLDIKTGNFAESGGVGTGGTLKLLSWDTAGKNISGVFSGIIGGYGIDSMKVTNGRFNTHYIVQ